MGVMSVKALIFTRIFTLIEKSYFRNGETAQ